MARTGAPTAIADRPGSDLQSPLRAGFLLSELAAHDYAGIASSGFAVNPMAAADQ
jgi:hypothetical protein